MRTWKMMVAVAVAVGGVGEAGAQSPPRVVRARPFVPGRPLVVHRGPGPAPPRVEAPAEPVVPAGYVRVMGEARLRGAMRPGVWWLPSSLHRPGARMPRVEPCVRWELERAGENWTLRHRRVFPREGGVREATQTATFLGGPVPVLLEESGSERWLRPPRNGTGGTAGWGRGSMQAYTLVAAPPGRLVWIEARGIVAYHPADTVVWFRSRAACVAALAGR